MKIINALIVSLLFLSSCSKQDDKLISVLNEEFEHRYSQRNTSLNELDMLVKLNPANEKKALEIKLLSDKIDTLILQIQSNDKPELPANSNALFEEIKREMITKMKTKNPEIDYWTQVDEVILGIYNNRSAFDSESFKVKFIISLIEAEMYFRDYLLNESNLMRFTKIKPFIEVNGNGQLEITIAAFNSNAKATFYPGDYQVSTEKGYKDYFIEDKSKALEFKNGQVKFESDKSSVIGIVEYYYDRSEEPIYYPIEYKSTQTNANTGYTK